MPVSLEIHSTTRDYQAHLETTPDFIAALATLPRACFAIDENVWKLYRDTWLSPLSDREPILVPIGEALKTLDTVQWLYEQLVRRPEKRNLTIVAFGGGILQDVVGFAASTLYRGVSWVFTPTTLLAQADSCIGSKTSLNFRGFKNLLGTFYPPERIHIYPPFLETQSTEDYTSGLGEVIKLHLMGGERLYRRLAALLPDLQARSTGALPAAIRTSLEVKLDYISGDEFDLGRRNLLNFGHDFGHALESVSDFRVPHGQAVVFGMLASNIVSRNRSLLHQHLEREIADALLIPALVVRPRPGDLSLEQFLDALGKDKKRTGSQLALVMMSDGFAFQRVNDLRPEEVGLALEELGQRLVEQPPHGSQTKGTP